MILIQKRPCDYLAKMKIVLRDDDFDIEYANLIRSNICTYKYQDFKQDFKTGYEGEVGWGGFGFAIFMFGLVCFACLSGIGTAMKAPIFKGIGSLIFLVSMFIGFAFFLLRFFKHEYIYIVHKRDSFFIRIRVNETSKEFIDEFKKRVEMANESQEQAK